jgi:precorrin-6A synthase
VRRVLVVGVGAGDPDHLTVQAIRALGRAQVIFELERATGDLTQARAELLARHLPAGHEPQIVGVAEPRRDRHPERYAEAVAAWRTARAAAWERAISDQLGPDGCGAFLVWGDPSLYDSTIAVLGEVLARGRVAFELEVIPGLSSLHALTARHRIALNRLGGAVLITTGRRLRDHGWPPGDVGDVVVMLDSGGAFRTVINEPLDIYWGAYLGTEDELLIAGPLDEVADEIERVRAAARERKGWVMDCYLLRSRAVE